MSIKYVSYDITFQEVPDEISLTFSISNCGKKCPECHSPWLQKNEGEELSISLLNSLLKKYADNITCVCFLGGQENEIKPFIPLIKCHELKVCWYTSDDFDKLPSGFDYIKTGEYISSLGGLNSPQTNQRFYKIENNIFEDITSLFYKN